MILQAFGGPIVGVESCFCEVVCNILYNLSYLWVTTYSHHCKSAKILKCLLSKMHLNLGWFCIKSVYFFLTGEDVKNSLYQLSLIFKKIENQVITI